MLADKRLPWPQAIALGDFSEATTPVIPEDGYVVDGDTGELMGEGSTEESLQQENSSVET